MKKLFIIIVCICLTGSAFAGFPDMMKRVVGQTVAAGGGCSGGTTIGQTDKGSYSTMPGDRMLFSKFFSPAASEQVTHAHAHYDGTTQQLSANSDVSIFIYSISGDTATKVGEAFDANVNVGGADEWINIALPSCIQLDSGTTYLIGWCADNSMTIDLSISDQREPDNKYYYLVETCDSSMPDSFDHTTGTQESSSKDVTVIFNTSAGDPT